MRFFRRRPREDQVEVRLQGDEPALPLAYWSADASDELLTEPDQLLLWIDLAGLPLAPAPAESDPDLAEAFERSPLSPSVELPAVGPGVRWRYWRRRDLLLTRRRAWRIRRFARRSGRALWAVTQWPGMAAQWALAVPGRLKAGIAGLPWDEMLSVRKGFLVGAVLGLCAAGSTLWGVSAIPYLTGRVAEPVIPPLQAFPIARAAVPVEMGWFYIQFPYLSPSATMRQKNRHTFIVSDGARRREYVISLTQRARRIEFYSGDDKTHLQVQIYTPGYKKTVWFRGAKLEWQSVVPDANLWMWKAPLWNATHLKIYGLADLWLDSPYKRYSCAGFVHRFLADAGIHVPILDAWDMAKQPWARVPIEEIEPGDIITIKAASASHRRFWHHRITHVGVYIGHGKMIHAATPTRTAARSWIRVSDLEDFGARIDKILRPPEMM